MAVDMNSHTKDMVADIGHTMQVKSDEIKQQLGASTEALRAKTAETVSRTEKLTRIKPIMNSARRHALPTTAVGIVLLVVLRLVWRRLRGRNS